MRIAKVLALGVLLGCIIALPALADPSVSGTSHAEISTDPGFPGYWKYCFEIDWHDGHGLSHFDIFLGLDSCLCVCLEGYFACADTVGTCTGTTNGDSCTVYWHCQFQCDGDPTIPDGEPLMKFEPYENACEPDTTASAHVCFYSVAAPTPHGTFTDAIAVKFGQFAEKGDLVGVLPSCDWDYSDLDASTWGQIKALFQ